jgi:hypothetical protein
MAILATLRQHRAGEWKTLDDYLRELRHRESTAVAALANALAAPPHEQKELAENGEAGAVLLEVACDLRVPKGSRLAAARCLLEAGIEPPFVGHLFIGAGDLVTDPRMGSTARRLVESGLPVALQLEGEPSQISLAAGALARAVHAAASTVGQARVVEMLAAAPEIHAGAAASRFALGIAQLSEGQKTGWKRLLEQTCAAHRRAPAAARRVGLAPAWPPNLPDAFAPMVQEAEEQTASVQSRDAAANPGALKPEAPPAASPAAKRQLAPPAVAPGKTLAPPIRRSPFRKAIGAVVEVPTPLPPKPMEPVAARPSRSPAAEPERPRVQPSQEAGTAARRTMPIPPLPARKREEPRFDPLGKRIPRADRWDDDEFQWETPVLPSSELPPPPRARSPAGPFASRLASIFEDRPEAVDRLCAAAQARAAIGGEEGMQRELSAELARWRQKRLPPEQRQRLGAVVRAEDHPASWRCAARLILDFFVSGAG